MLNEITWSDCAQGPTICKTCNGITIDATLKAYKLYILRITGRSWFPHGCYRYLSTTHTVLTFCIGCSNPEVFHALHLDTRKWDVGIVLPMARELRSVENGRTLAVHLNGVATAWDEQCICFLGSASHL